MPGVRPNAFCAALLPEPTLPGLPGGCCTRLAGQTTTGTFAGPVFSFGVHAAACAQPADSTKPAGALRSVVRGRDRDVIGVWSKSLWRPTWDHGSAAYLEPDANGPLPPPLYRHRRGPFGRRNQMGQLVESLPVCRACSLKSVSWKVLCRAGAALSWWAAAISRKACRHGQPQRLRATAAPGRESEMGGLFQASLCRTAPGTRLPFALHPPSGAEPQAAVGPGPGKPHRNI